MYIYIHTYIHIYMYTCTFRHIHIHMWHCLKPDLEQPNVPSSSFLHRPYMLSESWVGRLCLALAPQHSVQV